MQQVVAQMPWGHHTVLHLEFLDIGGSTRERDLERALLTHLRDFLLELGVGFALVGSQYGLEVGGQDYRIDLLFYHLRLRCFVAVELKMGPFQPEHAGKTNFYLSALDECLRRDDDEPSIGLILCKERNKMDYVLVHGLSVKREKEITRYTPEKTDPRDADLNDIGRRRLCGVADYSLL